MGRMSRKAEFTIAQQFALDEAMYPTQTKRRLSELTIDNIEQLIDVAQRLPMRTTRQWVTKRSILDKLYAEREERRRV